MKRKQFKTYKNVPHYSQIRYKMVAEGERDSSFLLSNGKNKWPLVEKTSEEIQESLRKFHNRFLPKTLDFSVNI